MHTRLGRHDGSLSNYGNHHMDRQEDTHHLGFVHSPLGHTHNCHSESHHRHHQRAKLGLDDE